QGMAFYQQLEQHVSSQPGIESVCFSNILPLAPASDQDTTIFIDGYTPPNGVEGVVIVYNIISPNYFRTMGIPILQGRDFTTQDRDNSPPVVLINETAARQYWPGQNPIGKQVRFGKKGPYNEVIGLVRDGKYVTFGEEPRPYIYLPMLQNYISTAVLHARNTGEPGQIIAAVQDQVRSIDKDLPSYNVKTMKQHLEEALLGPRIAASILGVFGAMALLLASNGIYCVMAY